MTRPFLILLATTVIGCDLDKDGIGDMELAREWSAADMASDVSGRQPSQSCIIAKRVMVDDRPLYVESAIVMFKLDGDWSIHKIYRHPREQSADASVWHTSWVSHGDESTWQRTYQMKPSIAELGSFINASRFRELSSGWQSKYFEENRGACDWLS